MSLRDDLAGVLARDPRYPIQAYAFVFEALEFTKTQKKRSQGRGRSRPKGFAASRHVTGRELCE
ncbi:Minf_1886 family protein, partial [Singulisphaera rosea]